MREFFPMRINWTRTSAVGVGIGIGVGIISARCINFFVNHSFQEFIMVARFSQFHK